MEQLKTLLALAQGRAEADRNSATRTDTKAYFDGKRDAYAHAVKLVMNLFGTVPSKEALREVHEVLAQHERELLDDRERFPNEYPRIEREINQVRDVVGWLHKTTTAH